MKCIDVRAGFLILGSLLLGAFLVPEEGDVPKTSSPAEADFRTNDRDWNHINDFWGGVSSLYTMTSVSVTPEAPRRPSSDAVRCMPLDYWDRAGEYKGNLWMLYRMCSRPRGSSPTPEELLQRDGDELLK